MDRGIEMGQDGEPSGAAPLRDASRPNLAALLICTGCGHDSRVPIAPPALACCPDNRYRTISEILQKAAGECRHSTSMEVEWIIDLLARSAPEAASAEGSPSHPSGPSQDSQEVREAAQRLVDVWEACEEEPDQYVKALAAALSQSPKGAAGRSERESLLERELVATAKIHSNFVAHANEVLDKLHAAEDKVRLLEEQIQLLKAGAVVAVSQAEWDEYQRLKATAPSPTTAGAAGARECWVLEARGELKVPEGLLKWKTRKEVEDYIADVYEPGSTANPKPVRMIEAAGWESGPSAPKTGLREPSAQEYRDLVHGEIIEATDEVWAYGKGPWAPVLPDVIGTPYIAYVPGIPRAHHATRRRIEAAQPPLSEAKGPDLPPSSQPAPGDVGEAGGVALERITFKPGLGLVGE